MVAQVDQRPAVADQVDQVELDMQMDRLAELQVVAQVAVA
jgi:hypothetical protein